MHVIQALLGLHKKGNIDQVHRLLQRPEVRQEVQVWAHEAWQEGSCCELLQYPELRAALHIWGGEALCIAVEKGDLPLVCELLQDPEIRRQAWLSPAWYVALHCSYRQNPVTTNKILQELEKAPRTSAQGKPYRYPGYPLCEAVATGKTEELRTLLQDPKQVEAWGSHALYFVASHGRPGIKILLEDPHIRAQAHIGQNAALRAAAKNHDSAIVLELLRHDNVRREAHVAENEALRWAAAYGDRESVDALLTIEKVCQNAHVFNNQALKKAIKKREEKVVFPLLTLKNVQEALSPEEWQEPMIQSVLIERYNLLLFLKGAQEPPLELLREILTFLPIGQPYLDLKKNERYVESVLLRSKKIFAASKALPAATIKEKQGGSTGCNVYPAQNDHLFHYEPDHRSPDIRSPLLAYSSRK